MRGVPPFGGLPPTPYYRGVNSVGQKSEAGSPDLVALTLFTSTINDDANNSLIVLRFLD